MAKRRGLEGRITQAPSLHLLVNFGYCSHILFVSIIQYIYNPAAFSHCPSPLPPSTINTSISEPPSRYAEHLADYAARRADKNYVLQSLCSSLPRPPPEQYWYKLPNRLPIDLLSPGVQATLPHSVVIPRIDTGTYASICP